MAYARIRRLLLVPGLGLGLGLVASGIGLTSRRAAAYVRATTPKTLHPLVWPSSCVGVIADARGSRDLSIDSVDATLDRATRNWQSVISSCSYMSLYALRHDRVRDVGVDQQPVLVFREVSWERGGVPRDPSAIAITTVFHVNDPGGADDGTILDADIEMNGVNFTFITSPSQQAREGTVVADLENTLTHELGHVLGLAHTCWDGSGTQPVDGNGNPVPLCGDTLPSSIVNATMYPYSDPPGETTKRMVKQDDINGICQPYPSTAQPAGCYPVIQGACAAAPGGVGSGRAWPLAAGLVGALAAWLLRRRAA